MEIKSKKAKDICMILNVFLEQTIIQVESDARDRAIKAFCKSCSLQGGEECPVINECECSYLEEFEQAYDNE